MLKGHMGIRGYQIGGRVFGYGGGDKIPALLEGGEFIIRKEVAKDFTPLLQRLNEGGGIGDGRQQTAAD